jgi:hypothetical protein
MKAIPRTRTIRVKKNDDAVDIVFVDANAATAVVVALPNKIVVIDSSFFFAIEIAILILVFHS